MDVTPVVSIEPRVPVGLMEPAGSHGRSTIEIKFSTPEDAKRRKLPGAAHARHVHASLGSGIREFMSRRQILSGFGGKHRTPTRARKSPATRRVSRGSCTPRSDRERERERAR